MFDDDLSTGSPGSVERVMVKHGPEQVYSMEVVRFQYATSNDKRIEVDPCRFKIVQIK